MKILTLCITAILTAAPAKAGEKDEYRNPTVGLSLRKPTKWRFITAEENTDNLKRTKLSDKEFQKKMEKYATVPLVALTKHPEPFDDINPSFKINIKPIGNFDPKDPKRILSLVTKPFPKIFKDFKVVTAPTDTRVSGLAAAYVKIHYSLEIPDGRSFPTCSELWIVPRGSHFFMIGVGTRQDESTGKRSEIRAILDSLKLAEKRADEPPADEKDELSEAKKPTEKPKPSK